MYIHFVLFCLCLVKLLVTFIHFLFFFIILLLNTLFFVLFIHHIGGYMGDFSSRLEALSENTEYSVRIRAVNSMGVSAPSSTSMVTTYLHGGLPSLPQTVILGQYKTSTSMSLSYVSPQTDGGLPVTAYLIELDTTLAFNPEYNSYNSVLLANIPEVQRITTSYRAGDNVNTRGGTFTLTFGGWTTAALSYSISAYDLEVAINVLVGTRQVAVPPVLVSRQVWNRGYRWIVTFMGHPGE